MAQILSYNIGDQTGSLFAIRGNLDGELEADYSQKEQFIGMKIGSEEFFMTISAVSEIVMLQSITFVPKSHPMLEGVINLRGIIMPALNLRRMMGLDRGKPTPATRMIISYYQETPVALIVDGITYVVSLLPSEIEEQSLPGRGQGADFISRISKGMDRIIGILDLQKIVSSVVDESVFATEEVEEAGNHEE